MSRKPRYTIDDCHGIASKRGGRCLSEVYVHCKHPMSWECSNGHQFTARLDCVVHSNMWCPCHRAKPVLSLSDCIRHAQEKKGECLSTEYINHKTNMRWRCEHGHEWLADFNGIRNAGEWCPYCGKTRKKTLQDCINVAAERGGNCLSTAYKGSSVPLLWECSKGHTWSAKFNHVLNAGSWCPDCGGSKPLTIDDCIDEATKHGGKCLSTTYNNMRGKLQWQCSLGHIWETSLLSIKHQGSWCPACDIQTREERCLKKHGVRNTGLLESVKAKTRRTMIARHGVDYAAQNREIALKQARSLRKAIIKKHWNTGEEVVCVASYECAVVDMLNEAQIEYEWQPRTFKLPNNKTYRPDLYLNDLDLWVEIKGYMRPLAKAKWDWFTKEHTNSVLWDKQALIDMNVISSRRSRCR